MPEAAIATGVVDLVLSGRGHGRPLVEFARSRRDDDDASMPAQQDVGGAPESPELRRQIAQLLHAQVGHDFSGYKEKSFLRRVRRRMQILQLSDLAAYVQRLEKEPEEVKLLFRDLLIGVTNFFRDQEAFDALKEQVIPKLFEGLGAADSVRIWVPGCATGEEAYSIAILVREHMQSLKAIPTVQIFATDIDDAALTAARRGRYPHAWMENLAPERLARFFVRDDVSYTVVKELRDLCIFSLHSVLRDPPFSRIDLISCRNLLIYLGTEFQGRVIPIFHVALRPRGYLFLGTSESISQYSDLFQRIDNKQRLFQRRDHAAAPFPLTFAPGIRAAASGAAARRDPSATASGLRATVESRVMEHFAPPHVAVNRDGDIVHYSSRTGRYLEAAAGMPSRQLLASARRGLRLDLRHAFQEALESRRPAVREGVAVEIDDHIQTVRITVEPIGAHESDPLFLVIFSDVGRPQLPAEMAAGRRGGDGSVEQLERELRDTRDRLQVTIEEYEASLEEMKSGNEEMVSVNEELQSTNEELETSKEELQSVNEELQTVNSELNSKVEELDRANADLRNLFETTQVGTIFLDNQLVIRSFTPAATSVFNLISTDRGRPLTDIVSRFDYDGFEREIRSVLERGETIERRVHRSDGKTHYLMRILPYRGRNNVTEGIVVTFFDVTKLVQAEEQQRTLMEELNHRVRNMLTVVTAIAQAAHARSESPEHFITSFTARLRAMAATYNLLSRQNWGDVGLRDVLEAVIAPYRRNNEDRFKLEGPVVLLRPKAVLAFGLAAHELAANAAKYGALSNDKGTVSIGWQQEGRRRRTIAALARGERPCPSRSRAGKASAAS